MPARGRFAKRPYKSNARSAGQSRPTRQGGRGRPRPYGPNNRVGEADGVGDGPGVGVKVGVAFWGVADGGESGVLRDVMARVAEGVGVGDGPGVTLEVG